VVNQNVLGGFGAEKTKKNNQGQLEMNYPVFFLLRNFASHFFFGVTALLRRYGTFCHMSDNESTESNQHKKEQDDVSYETANCISYGICCGALWLLFLIPLLVGLSFHTIKYFEIALVERVTGVVEYDHVLTQGIHYLPLTKKPVTFPATQNRVAFLQQTNNALVVFSEQSLEFDFNIEFSYRLVKEGLGSIFRDYGLNFDDRVEKMSQSILKDQAVNYTSDDYIRERDRINQDFAYLLKERLEQAIPIVVDFDMVILMEIHFPDSLVNKNLDSAIEIQNNTLQLNQQAVDLIKVETDRMVAGILAQANFTLADAEIRGNQSISEATIEANIMQLDANSEGLHYAIAQLGLNSQETDGFLRAMAFRKNVDVKVVDGSFASLVSFSS
jgi:hypothetical protein